MSGTWRELDVVGFSIAAGTATTLKSSAIDIGQYSEYGLLFGTMRTGSASFEVAASLDATYRTLAGSAGATVYLAVGTGNNAFEGLNGLSPYANAKVVVNASQSGAVSGSFICKS